MRVCVCTDSLVTACRCCRFGPLSSRSESRAARFGSRCPARVWTVGARPTDTRVHVCVWVSAEPKRFCCRSRVSGPSRTEPSRCQIRAITWFRPVRVRSSQLHPPTREEEKSQSCRTEPSRTEQSSSVFGSSSAAGDARALITLCPCQRRTA